MKTKYFGPEEKPYAEFCHDDETLQLRSMFGVMLGNNGAVDGDVRKQGMMLLCADEKRYEGNALTLVGKEFDDSHVDTVWKTIDGKLEIRSRCQFDEATGIISRKDTLVNISQQAVILRRYLYRFVLSPGRYEAYYQESRWLNENQGHWSPIVSGDIVLKNQWGRTSEGGTPYTCVREIGVTNGIALHIIPCGNWMIKISCRPNSSALPFVVVELGLSDEDLYYPVKPGESVEMPEILCQELPEGEPRLAAPLLHQYVNSRLPADMKPYMPVIYNSWLHKYANLAVDDLRKQLSAVKELGCEVFVIDAGWFGKGEGWATRGDWREKTDGSFFGKMGDFADEVRSEGLGFGLWMEPETFVAQAPIKSEKPQWFTGTRMNLQIREAYDYLFAEISRLIDTYRLAYMKMDMNEGSGYDEFGGELHTYTGCWNSLIDELRLKYPQVFFENCSSGGMRLDLNTMMRFDGHFPTDTASPMEILRISQGVALRLPLGRMIHWVVIKALEKNFIPDWGNIRDNSVLTPQGATWNTAERVSLDFALAVGCMGMLGFSGDLVGLSEKSNARAKWFVDFHKTHRRFITSSVTHLITPFGSIEDRGGWIVFQFHNSENSIVFVYHRANDGQSVKNFKLKGLKPSATYEVSRESFEPELRIKHATSGQILMDAGLKCEMPSSVLGTYDSAIFLVKEAGI